MLPVEGQFARAVLAVVVEAEENPWVVYRLAYEGMGGINHRPVLTAPTPQSGILSTCQPPNLWSTNPNAALTWSSSVDGSVSELRETVGSDLSCCFRRHLPDGVKREMEKVVFRFNRISQGPFLRDGVGVAEDYFFSAIALSLADSEVTGGRPVKPDMSGVVHLQHPVEGIHRRDGSFDLLEGLTAGSGLIFTEREG